MEVLVEPLNIEIEQLGLQTVKLQSDIRQRLQKAGITVLTERERLATPTAAMLGSDWMLSMIGSADIFTPLISF